MNDNQSGADAGKVLHRNGKVVLSLRKNVWQSRIKLQDGTYDRWSTSERDLQAAKDAADIRYAQVLVAQQNGSSIRGTSFEKAAREYIQHLNREVEQNALKKRTGIDRTITLLDRYMIKYFDSAKLETLNAASFDAYHDWYVSCRMQVTKTERVAIRHRDNRGKTYATPIVIKNSRPKLRKPGAASVRSGRCIFRAVFRFAALRGYISNAHLPLFARSRVPVRRRRGAFTLEEQRRLLTHLEQRVTATLRATHQARRRMLYLYVKFLLLTGLRPRTECRLRFRDVEQRAGDCILFVRDGKTGSRETVVPLAVVQIIDELRRSHPNPTPDAPIWADREGKEVIHFGQQFVAVLDELGMRHDAEGLDRSLYSCRHSRITALLTGSTLQPKIIAENVGTSVAMIDQHYAHIRIRDHAADLGKSWID